MGIALGHADFIIRNCAMYGLRGRVLTLGRQDVYLTLPELCHMLTRHGLGTIVGEEFRFREEVIGQKVNALITAGAHLNSNPEYPELRGMGIVSDRLFFTALGFDRVDALDMDDYEGANILFDLNQEDIREAVHEPCDLLIDTGVMEHFFDVRKLFRHAFRATASGGCIIHILPSNNFCDHGFYQLSPTLFTDYYEANQYDILLQELIEYQYDPYSPNAHIIERIAHWRSWPYSFDRMRPLSFGGLGNGMYFSASCARKTERTTEDKVPIQRIYRK
jgi:hypothetical protein